MSKRCKTYAKTIDIHLPWMQSNVDLYFGVHWITHNAHSHHDGLVCLKIQKILNWGNKGNSPQYDTGPMVENVVSLRWTVQLSVVKNQRTKLDRFKVHPFKKSVNYL